ncbi:MAG: type II toxin-antitoxin system HicB family antitoxin [Chloroflexi bacterium]|nr:type II toxin-antitoxin system HicB family antitoxin [Chloroflexota bacterium]
MKVVAMIDSRQVILHPEPTGGYSVTVPSLPGCFSEGATREEALANIREAIQLHIECMLEDGEDVPPAYPFLVESIEVELPHAEATQST